MNCMKCGRECEEGQSFCTSCLETAEKYPVRPNVVIHLPQRKPRPVKRQAQRRQPPTDRQRIQRLKKVIRVLTAMVLVLMLILGITGWMISRQIKERRKPLPGQNYSTATTPAESTEPTEDPKT